MVGPIAILCSGQGTQHPGMFDLVAQAPEAQGVWETARAVLEEKDPRQFVRDADPATLYSNRVGQILCCTQALAAWAMINSHLVEPVIIAGYSVGELAAWGCAGLCGEEPLPDPALPPLLIITMGPLMDTPLGPISTKLPPTFSESCVPASSTMVIPAFR